MRAGSGRSFPTLSTCRRGLSGQGGAPGVLDRQPGAATELTVLAAPAGVEMDWSNYPSGRSSGCLSRWRAWRIGLALCEVPHAGRWATQPRRLRGPPTGRSRPLGGSRPPVQGETAAIGGSRRMGSARRSGPAVPIALRGVGTGLAWCQVPYAGRWATQPRRLRGSPTGRCRLLAESGPAGARWNHRQ